MACTYFSFVHRDAGFFNTSLLCTSQAVTAEGEGEGGADGGDGQGTVLVEAEEERLPSKSEAIDRSSRTKK